MVSECDVIITMLPSSVEVLAILNGPGGVIECARAGQILLDMSTIEPEATMQVAEAASAKGVHVVDAPVGRLASHADRGESLFMVGAEPADLERLRPMLNAMGTTVLHTAGRLVRVLV